MRKMLGLTFAAANDAANPKASSKQQQQQHQEAESSYDDGHPHDDPDKIKRKRTRRRRNKTGKAKVQPVLDDDERHSSSPQLQRAQKKAFSPEGKPAGYVMNAPCRNNKTPNKKPSRYAANSKHKSKTNASNSSIKKKQHDKPMTKRDLYFALKVGMVPITGGSHSVGRVTLVNWDGEVVYDTYVQVPVPVSDGYPDTDKLSADNGAVIFATARGQVEAMLRGKILIGHGLDQSLMVLGLSHPWCDVRDAAKYARFNSIMVSPSLETLVQTILKRNLSDPKKSRRKGKKDNTPVSECVAAIDLYKAFRKEWEQDLVDLMAKPQQQQQPVSHQSPPPQQRPLYNDETQLLGGTKNSASAHIVHHADPALSYQASAMMYNRSRGMSIDSCSSFDESSVYSNPNSATGPATNAQSWSWFQRKQQSKAVEDFSVSPSFVNSHHESVSETSSFYGDYQDASMALYAPTHDVVPVPTASTSAPPSSSSSSWFPKLRTSSSNNNKPPRHLASLQEVDDDDQVPSEGHNHPTPPAAKGWFTFRRSSSTGGAKQRRSSMENEPHLPELDTAEFEEDAILSPGGDQEEGARSSLKAPSPSKWFGRRRGGSKSKFEEEKEEIKSVSECEEDDEDGDIDVCDLEIEQEEECFDPSGHYGAREEVSSKSPKWFGFRRPKSPSNVNKKADRVATVDGSPAFIVPDNPWSLNPQKDTKTQEMFQDMAHSLEDDATLQTDIHRSSWDDMVSDVSDPPAVNQPANSPSWFTFRMSTTQKRLEEEGTLEEGTGGVQADVLPSFARPNLEGVAEPYRFLIDELGEAKRSNQPEGSKSWFGFRRSTKKRVGKNGNDEDWLEEITKTSSCSDTVDFARSLTSSVNGSPRQKTMEDDGSIDGKDWFDEVVHGRSRCNTASSSTELEESKSPVVEDQIVLSSQALSQISEAMPASRQYYQARQVSRLAAVSKDYEEENEPIDERVGQQPTWLGGAAVAKNGEQVIIVNGSPESSSCLKPAWFEVMKRDDDDAPLSAVFKDRSANGGSVDWVDGVERFLQI